MISVLNVVACALTFSEVFGSTYLYGPHQNPVSIYSPYDYYYIRNLHRVNWAPPSNAPPVVTSSFIPAPVVTSQLLPSTTVARAPVAAPITAPVAAPVAPISAPAAAPPASDAAREGYSFSYEIEAPDSRQSRQETADAAGNVRGSYSFSLNDGRQRTVNYVAGADGFKAVVDTNEPGTEQKNPADVVIANSAPLPAAPANLPVARAPSAQAPKAVQPAPFAPTPNGYDW